MPPEPQASVKRCHAGGSLVERGMRQRKWPSAKHRCHQRREERAEGERGRLSPERKLLLEVPE